MTFAAVKKNNKKELVVLWQQPDGERVSYLYNILYYVSSHLYAGTT